MEISVRDRILGCLLGGACGDALGAPFQFTSHFEMLAEHGRRYGVRDFWTDGGTLGAVTDDTQLVALTASALRAARYHPELTEHEHLHLAYLTWFGANGGESPILAEYPRCHDELAKLVMAQGDRVPCSISLECLATATRLGQPTANRSQGCGAAKRVAPIGLVYSAAPKKAFAVAVDTARLTHGHHAAYLAAGAFAMLIALVTSGIDLRSAVRQVLRYLHQFPGGDEIYNAVVHAPFPRPPRNGSSEWFGYGWTGPEALAIAVHAVITTDTLEQAVVAACNHDGNSDTTASMAGNLAGALYGPAIPERWLNYVEMRKELKVLARELCRITPNCSRSR